MAKQAQQVFEEIQMIRSWILWVILVGLIFMSVLGTLYQAFTGNMIGNNPMPTWAWALMALFMALLTVGFMRLRLTTRIDRQEIFFDYGILGSKQIKWSEVHNAKVLNYGFAGIGVRISTRYGTIYNTGGREGLSIKLKDGSRYVLGTQKSKELKDFLKRLKKI